MESGENTPFKKFICLHCGHVFDSDRDAPKCPNCGRRKVIPVETLGESLKKHKDKLKELGVLPEPDPEPQDSEPQETKVEETKVETKDLETSKPEPVKVEQKVEESEPVENFENSELGGSSEEVPESDHLLEKYLEELEDVPEKPKGKPKKSRSQKRKRSITVPVGPSLIEVLVILGVIVLLWKWWTSRASKSNEENVVPRSSKTLYQLHRNIGYRALG